MTGAGNSWILTEEEKRQEEDDVFIHLQLFCFLLVSSVLVLILCVVVAYPIFFVSVRSFLNALSSLPSCLLFRHVHCFLSS